MDTIDHMTIKGAKYRFYRVGIGRTHHIYYHVASKEAVGVPEQGGRDPAKVLLDAILNPKPDVPPKLIEVTDDDKWQRMTLRFRN
jgi:hypothetical protein